MIETGAIGVVRLRNLLRPTEPGKALCRSPNGLAFFDDRPTHATMKPKVLMIFQALGMSALFTGCDDDQIEYAFSSDGGLFFFAFGKTVDTKPRKQVTATTHASGQTQSTNTNAVEDASASSETNSYQRLTHVFEWLTPATTLESPPITPAQDGTSASSDTWPE